MGRLTRKLASACLMAGIALGSAAAARADEQDCRSIRSRRSCGIICCASPRSSTRRSRSCSAVGGGQRSPAAGGDRRATRPALEAAHTPVGGNPDGDVTLVEFFDYRCAYCRRVVPSMQALLDEDPELRVVFKELPVLGRDSVRAARAALASRTQGGYVPFHFALMSADDLSIEGIRAVAAAVGLDADRLEADMASPEVNAAIEANYELGQRARDRGHAGIRDRRPADPGRGRQGPARAADPGGAPG